MVRIRTAGPVLVLGTALALVLPLSSATAVERYDEPVRGGLVVTGNTLGLAKDVNVNGPGTQDSIGTFVSAGSAQADTIPANPGNPWPAGTTAGWEDNASAATLSLPAGATVTYAELVWGGSYAFGVENVAASLDTSVELRYGAAAPVQVAPDPATATTIDGGTLVKYYSRSADVTDFVSAHGSGSYTVGHVPATQHEAVNTPNAAGWSLAVAYALPGESLRRVTIDVSGAWVDDLATHDVTFAGICTGNGGSISVAAVEGDANRAGDQLLAGPEVADLSVRSTTNNPASNFFASQLNDATGALDTSGTFGSVNHDSQSGVNVTGGRQGTDVTTLPVPDAALDEQDLVVRYATTSDTYLPLLTGAAVLTDAPTLTASAASLSPAKVRPGGQLTLTAPVSNNGNAGAQSATFTLPLPAGVTATAVTVDGATRPVAELGTGVPLGTLEVGATKTVRVILTSTRTTATALSGVVDYSYTDCTAATRTASTSLVRNYTVDSLAPQTTLTAKPKKRSTKGRAVFRFSSSEAGSFECSMDGRAFSTCTTGRRYRVAVGKHTFRVRAVDGVGNRDGSPATYRFKRIKTPKG